MNENSYSDTMNDHLYVQSTPKLDKSKPNCFPISSFTPYNSYIDWKELQRLQSLYHTFNSETTSHSIGQRPKKHLCHGDSGLTFVQLYSQRSHLDSKFTSIYVKMGKPFSGNTGPTEMLQFAKKLKSILNSTPGLKKYYTRLFYHYIAFYRRLYLPSDTDFPLRFLFFVRTLNEANYLNGKIIRRHSNSPSEYTVNEGADDDTGEGYCDLTDVKVDYEGGDQPGFYGQPYDPSPENSKKA